MRVRVRADVPGRVLAHVRVRVRIRRANCGYMTSDLTVQSMYN